MNIRAGIDYYSTHPCFIHFVNGGGSGGGGHKSHKKFRASGAGLDYLSHGGGGSSRPTHFKILYGSDRPKPCQLQPSGVLAIVEWTGPPGQGYTKI